MGSCMSSSSDHQQQAATVISSTGDIHRFETPVTVSEVLYHLSFSSLSKTTFFLTNSDSLSYEDPIPAMSSNEELDNQIYFMFPLSSLNSPLSASQMAALAVTASQALRNGSSESSSLSLSGKSVLKKPVRNTRTVKSKISPYVEMSGDADESGYEYNYATVKRGGIERSSSLRKIHKYSSKRAKLAVRSFRLKLSTIHEGSVAQFF